MSNQPQKSVSMDDHGGIEEQHELSHGKSSIFPSNPPDAGIGMDIQWNTEMELSKAIIEKLGLTTELARAVVPVVIRNLVTLERKQKDYGSHNLTKFGVRGVIVRMSDKMERIINLSARREAELLKLGEALPTFNEPMSDSFLDIQNYGLIAYVMDRGLWPRSK